MDRRTLADGVRKKLRGAGEQRTPHRRPRQKQLASSGLDGSVEDGRVDTPATSTPGVIYRWVMYFTGRTFRGCRGVKLGFRWPSGELRGLRVVLAVTKLMPAFIYFSAPAIATPISEWDDRAGIEVQIQREPWKLSLSWQIARPGFKSSAGMFSSSARFRRDARCAALDHESEIRTTASLAFTTAPRAQEENRHSQVTGRQPGAGPSRTPNHDGASPAHARKRGPTSPRGGW